MSNGLAGRSTLLAIGGGAVLLGLVGLWFVMREPAAGPGTPSTEVTPPTPSPAIVHPGQSVTPSAPSLPATGEVVREQQVGDGKIRDHRRGDAVAAAPVEVAAPPSPQGPMIQPTVTASLGRKVSALVRECASTLPREARVKASRLEGKVTIAIKDKQITITSATFQPTNIPEASVAPIKQCIEAKSLSVTDTADEPDVASYDITLSYAL